MPVSACFLFLLRSATHLFALALPHRSMLCSCSSVHESRSTDLTLLIWVPMPLWIPEHLSSSSASLFAVAAWSGGGIPDADEDSQIPAGPSRVCRDDSQYSFMSVSSQLADRLTLVPLAVGAALVRLELDQALESLLVLGRTLGLGIGCAPRHCGSELDVRRKWSEGEARAES